MSLSFACLYLCHLIFHHYMVVSAAPHCMDSIHVSMNHPWRNSSSSVPSKMHIGLIVVGTRGDLNPFLVLAKALVKKGHVVRLASHELYRDSIETTHGLEFGPLAGDPVVLSEFMVRTKGSIVSPASFHDRRKLSRVIREIMFSTWTAMTDDRFIPDAIIANPTNYGDTAIAEKLHIPVNQTSLLLEFTYWYSHHSHHSDSLLFPSAMGSNGQVCPPTRRPGRISSSRCLSKVEPI